MVQPVTASSCLLGTVQGVRPARRYAVKLQGHGAPSYMPRMGSRHSFAAQHIPCGCRLTRRSRVVRCSAGDDRQTSSPEGVAADSSSAGGSSSSSSSGGAAAGQPSGGDGNSSNLISTVGLFAIWAGLLGYALLLSPNQTPLRDSYFLEKLVGLGEPDGVAINAVFSQLFNIMGVYPAIYAALLIPSARSGNKVPAWPFVAASFGVGFFALAPYFALWTPGAPSQRSDSQAQAEWQRKAAGALESSVTALLLAGGAAFFVFRAASAGGGAWAEYLRLFNESRFVHVTSVDFAALTACIPFWLYNDAQARDWKQRDTLWMPILALTPVVGPAIYLLLRPKTDA